MRIEYLRYFVSVADCLNFTRAAKENHIAQTAISRCIAGLEDELGVRLFERNNRHVKLTPEGIQFYIDITVVLQKYDQAVKNVQSIKKGFLGHIHIGIGVYEDSFVSLVLKDFHKRYPDFNATLGQFSYSRLYQMISEGELDIAFMNSFFCEETACTASESVGIYDLFRVEVGAIVNKEHILSVKKCITKEDINNKNVLLYNDGQKSSIGRLASLKVHPRNTIQFNSFSGLISMVKANYGIGFAPGFIKESLPPDMVMLPQAVFPAGRCFVMTSKLRHNPASDYFMNIVKISSPIWEKLDTKA